MTALTAGNEAAIAMESRIANSLLNKPALIYEPFLDALIRAPGATLLAAPRPVLSIAAVEAKSGGTPKKLGIIRIRGALFHHSIGWGDSYEEIREAIMEAGTSPEIGGILVSADSGGGEAAGNFDLADDFRKVAQVKPLWAISDGAAYSGAFSLISQAHRLLLTREGGVGSVGVIMQHADLSKRLEMLGIRVRSFTSGAKKDMGSPYRPPTESEEAELLGIVNKINDIFVAMVPKGRPMLSERAIRDTEGGIFIGRDAIAVGFADAISTEADALKELREHIKAGNPVSVSFKPGALVDAAAFTEMLKENMAAVAGLIAGADAPTAGPAAIAGDRGKLAATALGPQKNPAVEAAAIATDHGSTDHGSTKHASTEVQMADELKAAAGASPPVDGGGTATGPAATAGLSTAQTREIMDLGVLGGLTLPEVNAFVAAGKTPADVRAILIERRASAQITGARSIDSGSMADFGMSEYPDNLLMNAMRKTLAARGLKPNDH